MASWLYLVFAIVLEVAGTVSMKLSDGFSKLTPSILIFVFYSLSFGGLTLALKKMDVSLVYAIWSGLGTALIAVIGFYYFQEPVNLIKVVSIGLIVTGVIGLSFSGGH